MNFTEISFIFLLLSKIQTYSAPLEGTLCVAVCVISLCVSVGQLRSIVFNSPLTPHWKKKLCKHDDENLSCKTTEEASFLQYIVHKADPDAALNV